MAAYQPKGAVSLAASYINLATPGTRNASAGVAPTFDTTTGWTFNGSSQYLSTSIFPASTWSMFVRFSNFTGTSGSLMGQTMGSRKFYIKQTNAAVLYANGGLLTQAPNLASGVLGIAGATAYRDGVGDGTITDGQVLEIPVFIGALDDSESPSDYANVKIQAACFYNTTLTPAQVTALVTAMAAL